MKKSITVFNSQGENLHVTKDHSKYVRNSQFPCFAMDNETGKLLFYSDANKSIEGTTMSYVLKSQNKN